jgi:hypothetical protein
MNAEILNKFMEDVKDAFTKAIGTSSSINEERDERSVENYVRTGGNTMENTTEPDPQGDIAITKDLPNVIQPATATLVDQMITPNEASVVDAPTGPVPANETFDGEGKAVAPTSEEMAEAVEKADAGKCSSCGQSLPVAKADDADETEEIEKSDDIAKADTCADCGKAMSLCDCMGKAADEAESKEEAAKETPADEKAEMKKSIWGGAFSAPLIPKL